MTSLLCHQCQGSVYVEGYPAGVPYVCPYCRGAMPPRTPSPVEADLRDQLAAVTAERDRAIADKNHLADGLAHALGMDPGHPLPLSMLASVRIVVAAADAVREERDRLAADLDAVRRAAWAFLAVAGAHGRYDAARCYDARQALRLLVGEPPPAPDHAED